MSEIHGQSQTASQPDETLVHDQKLSQSDDHSDSSSVRNITPNTVDEDRKEDSSSIYTHLPVGSIRLLRLELREGDIAEWSIEIHDRKTLQETGPEYTALSYVWFSKTESPVHLHLRGNGHHHRVLLQGNLFQALMQFKRNRQKTRDLGPSFIWADAICIDQGNIAERNHQVASMAEIYSNAKETMCWLGRYTAVAPFYDLLQRLRLNMNKEAFVRQHLHLLNVGIREISASQWFTRAWTFQELHLSKSATLCAGDWSISCMSFLGLFVAFLDSLTSGQRQNLSRYGFDGFDGFDIFNGFNGVVCDLDSAAIVSETILQMTQTFDTYANHKGYHFRSLLRVMQARRATDPRDKVYAVLGLAKAHLGFAPMEPDYALSAAEVFTRAAQVCIAESRSLDVLALLRVLDVPDLRNTDPDRDRGKCDIWPMWVPDFGAFKNVFDHEVDERRRRRWTSLFSVEIFHPKEGVQSSSMRTSFRDHLLISTGLAIGRVSRTVVYDPNEFQKLYRGHRRNNQPVQYSADITVVSPTLPEITESNRQSDLHVVCEWFHETDKLHRSSDRESCRILVGRRKLQAARGVRHGDWIVALADAPGLVFLRPRKIPEARNEDPLKECGGRLRQGRSYQDQEFALVGLVEDFGLEYVNPSLDSMRTGRKRRVIVNPGRARELLVEPFPSEAPFWADQMTAHKQAVASVVQPVYLTERRDGGPERLRGFYADFAIC